MSQPLRDDASNPDVWLPDGNHLVCTQGDAIFNRYKDAVQKLMEMIQDIMEQKCIMVLKVKLFNLLIELGVNSLQQNNSMRK